MSVVLFTCPHCGWTMNVATDPRVTAPRVRCGRPGCGMIAPLPGGWISRRWIRG